MGSAASTGPDEAPTPNTKNRASVTADSKHNHKNKGGTTATVVKKKAQRDDDDVADNSQQPFSNIPDISDIELGGNDANSKILKRMAFGQQGYKDQQRDYFDETLGNNIQMHRTSQISWNGK